MESSPALTEDFTDVATPVLPYKGGGSKRKQILLSLCMYSGVVSIGFLVGWMAPALTKLLDPVQTPLIRVITDNEINLLGSSVYLGVISGFYIGSFISNTKGRKPCLACGGVTITLSYLICATSAYPWLLILGRMITSMGVGISLTVFSTYIAEISSTEIRGILLTLTELSGAIGQLIAYLVGPYVSYVALTYVGFAFGLLFTVGVLCVPETPAFYVMKGKDLEAKTVLISLGREKDISDVLLSKPASESWNQVFKMRSNRRTLFIGICLCISQQTSGFGPVMMFSITIFSSIKAFDPDISIIIIGIMVVIASCIAPIFVENFGRKALLLLSETICSLCMVAVGLYFYLENIDHPLKDKLYWMPLVFLAIFLFSYNVGLCCIPNAILSEMFDSKARSPGIAICNTCGFIIGFIVTSLYGIMNTALGRHVTFWMYAVFCVLSLIFSLIFVPETKGKTLTEIQYMMNK